jgi:hypothetical protein
VKLVPVDESSLDFHNSTFEVMREFSMLTLTPADPAPATPLDRGVL